MTRIFLLLLCAGVAACGASADEPGAQLFTARYSQFLGGYDSVEQCQAANQGTVYNCTADLMLCENGGIQIIVTDIVNEGRYSRSGEHLLAMMHGGADVPFEIELHLAGDSFTSPQLGGSEPWLREPLDAEALAEANEACAAMEGRFWW